MARYVCDPEMVNEAINKLSEAKNELSDVNSQIDGGIGQISTYLSVDFGTIKGYKDIAENEIDQMISIINEKLQLIEDYNSAPWYKKIFSTIGLGAVKITEGFATSVEQLGDGIVSIVGFTSGIVGAEEFQESCAEYIKKDYVGDWYFEQYEDGFLSDVAKYSYMSHTGTAANVFKTAGVVTGMLVSTALLGGSNVAGMTIAGVSGLGSGTERGLQAGKSYNAAFARGLGQGAFNVAAAYGATKLFSSTAASTAANTSDDIFTNTLSLPSGGDTTVKLLGAGADDLTVNVASTADDVVSSVVNGADDVVSNISSGADDFIDSAGDIVRITGKNGETVKILGQKIDKSGEIIYKVEVNGYKDVVKAGRSAVQGFSDDFYTVSKASAPASSTAIATSDSFIGSASSTGVSSASGLLESGVSTSAGQAGSFTGKGLSTAVVAANLKSQTDNQIAKDEYRLANMDMLNMDVNEVHVGDVSVVTNTDTNTDIGIGNVKPSSSGYYGSYGGGSGSNTETSTLPSENETTSDLVTEVDNTSSYVDTGRVTITDNLSSDEGTSNIVDEPLDDTLVEDDLIDDSEIIYSPEINPSVGDDTSDNSNVMKTVLGVGAAAGVATVAGIGVKKIIDKAKNTNSIDDEEDEDDF